MLSSNSKVWFIQNTSTEGPGYFSDLLKRLKIPFKICDLERGDALPKIRDQDIVVVMGGPMSANDKTKTMLGLLKWIRALLDREIPYLGICLGLQTLVKAAGGKVVENSVKEIGLKMNDQGPFTCDLTSAGKRDRIFQGLPPSFPVFQLHGETVQLTDSMTLLAKGKWCQNQVVKVNDRAYGFQGHLEMTTDVLKEWLISDADLCQVNAKSLLQEWKKVEKKIHANCRHVFYNFLDPISALSKAQPRRLGR